MGSIEFNTPHLIPLVLELNIAVALVDYRLTPEHPHPTQVNDSLEGLKWACHVSFPYKGEPIY